MRRVDGQPALARRAEIVRVAAQFFDQEGYHRASMGRLATELGMAKATVYHYFGSKEEILYEIHQEFILILIEAQRARLGKGMPPSQQLLECMSDIMGLMESHRGHVRVFFEHHRELEGERKGAIRAQRRQYQSMVKDILSEGSNQGEFHVDDVRLTALAVFGMCNWAYQWFQVEGPMTTQEAATYLWETLMQGLAPRPC